MTTQLDAGATWWRWPVMPVAAVIGGTLGAIALGLIIRSGMEMTIGFEDDGWFQRYVLSVIVTALFGHLYTAIAMTIAPRGKVVAGTVMVTILCLFSVASGVLGWVAPEYPTGKAIETTVSGLAGCITAVTALMAEAKKLAQA